MVEWPKEKIAALPDERIEALRDNAVRLGKRDIAELCNDVLRSRKPVRPKRSSVRVGDDHRAQYVCEFHFVCPGEDGVTRNQDGTIWTGTWVVAEEHADSALKHGAVVALHTSRAAQSYL